MHYLSGRQLCATSLFLLLHVQSALSDLGITANNDGMAFPLPLSLYHHGRGVAYDAAPGSRPNMRF
jgi:hypothetical protein